ncbi:MAG: hypothetical protein NW217_02255 [Hyphomicrobiaceae bacterium]|nr:hypothetical protein [Hyphomicrobiaceae bacterium]
MYLAIPPQPDCATAWLAAAEAVYACRGREAYNVVIDVADPVANTQRSNPIIGRVECYLNEHDTSVFKVANTIFPQAIYETHGAPEFFDVFHQKLLPKVRKNERWSGYYFERMTHYRDRYSDPAANRNPLWEIIVRIRNPAVTALNKYELVIFDPERDVDLSPYGGQCLSFVSFKIQDGDKRRIALTAIYRNQYYIEKLLGNLIGLGRVLAFVAKETGLDVGALTIISTHAEIDPKGGMRAVGELLKACRTPPATAVQS